MRKKSDPEKRKFRVSDADEAVFAALRIRRRGVRGVEGLAVYRGTS